jgi:hypothetical protein
VKTTNRTGETYLIKFALRSAKLPLQYISPMTHTNITGEIWVRMLVNVMSPSPKSDGKKAACLPNPNRSPWAYGSKKDGHQGEPPSLVIFCNFRICLVWIDEFISTCVYVYHVYKVPQLATVRRCYKLQVKSIINDSSYWRYKPT